MVQIIKNPFGEAIGEAGSALGQALAKRGQTAKTQRAGTILDEAIRKASIDPVTGQSKQINQQDALNIATSFMKAGGKSSDLAPYMQILAPGLKEQARLEGAEEFMQKIRPDGQQSVQQDDQQLSENGDVPTSQPPTESIGGYNQEQIDQMVGSRYEEIRRKGENLQKQMIANQKRAQVTSHLYTKLNEPSLKELNTKFQSGEENALRFDRMKEIFTKEADSLPSSFTAAMFDLEGEGFLSQLGRSQLSAPAQESIKLVVDMLSGAKDTYGARVTNFDAKQYLKKLPTLINTPKGRTRVLRDLSILNRLNQMHREGILNEFEKAGGSGAIAFSEAESRARKTNQKEAVALRDQFIHPDKNTFSKLPDASVYKGQRIEDETTGQIFISDGKDWKRMGEI